MIRRVAFACFSVLLMAFAGCSSLGGGAPSGQAQVTVSNVIEPQIQAKAEDVFFRHGFESKGAADGKMEFERQGSAMDRLLYGNWQEDDMSTRVTLYIIKKGPATYALRTRAMQVRNSFGGDSDAQMFDIQGARYKAILDKIVKELREESGAQ